MHHLKLFLVVPVLWSFKLGFVESLFRGFTQIGLECQFGVDSHRLILLQNFPAFCFPAHYTVIIKLVKHGWRGFRSILVQILAQLVALLVYIGRGTDDLWLKDQFVLNLLSHDFLFFIFLDMTCCESFKWFLLQSIWNFRTFFEDFWFECTTIVVLFLRFLIELLSNGGFSLKRVVLIKVLLLVSFKRGPFRIVDIFLILIVIWYFL